MVCPSCMWWAPFTQIVVQTRTTKHDLNSSMRLTPMSDRICTQASLAKLAAPGGDYTAVLCVLGALGLAVLSTLRVATKPPFLAPLGMVSCLVGVYAEPRV